MSLVQFISDLGEYAFLRNALLTSVMVGLICGVVGCFIILRGMALMGDAISHAVLPGVALSFLLGIDFFFGAVVAGLLTAMAIGWISQNSRIKNDSAMGIMFTAAFALGVLMITSIRSSVDLYHVLFGNVLAVTPSGMWTTVVTAVVVVILVVLFYRVLLVSTFDPVMATAYGLPAKWIHYALMAVLTVVTVASLQTVGIILVVSMLITPAATAYLLTNRLWLMIAYAAFFGVVSAVMGLYFSFVYNLASGATIVLVATVLFLLAFFFAPRQGLVWKWWRKTRGDGIYPA